MDGTPYEYLSLYVGSCCFKLLLKLGDGLTACQEVIEKDDVLACKVAAIDSYVIEFFAHVMASAIVGRLALAIDANVLVCGLDACLVEDSCEIAESLVILPLCAAGCENDNEILQQSAVLSSQIAD